ncbi:MAG: hypothetical protein U0325_30255 [Polyangiales bacterium]
MLEPRTALEFLSSHRAHGDRLADVPLRFVFTASEHRRDAIGASPGATSQP